MQANRLQTVWIMMCSGYYMAKICFAVIFRSLRGQLTREWADSYCHRWANEILGVIKLKCKVFNPHNVDFEHGNQRYLIMVNHSSLYDIPITYHTLSGSIRMVAKKELFKIPFFGRTMRLCEVPSIDRQNREQAIKDLQFAQNKMESGLTLWMAPEGTRSKDGKLGRLKKGGFVMAIRSKATIIPIGIRGADKILPAKTWQFYLNQTVEVHIGKPVDTNDYGLDARNELLAKVESQLRELMGET